LLIVVSRLANESLWAEVLNLGGFDVLALPFDREELERVTLSAVRRSRHASSSVPLSQFRSVRPISPLLGHGSTLVAGLRRHTAPWAKVLGGADVESNIRGLQEPRAASTTKTGSL
jgi:DNA-binding response OmpR family regulator